MATPMIPGGPHANGGIPILVAPQQPYIPTSVSQGFPDIFSNSPDMTAVWRVKTKIRYSQHQLHKSIHRLKMLQFH